MSRPRDIDITKFSANRPEERVLKVDEHQAGKLDRERFQPTDPKRGY